MSVHNRREFLGEVGKGMLAASVGTGLATELGISTAMAEEADRRVDFGSLEKLAGQMQDTAPDAMQRELIRQIQEGGDLKKIVAAGALANARTFGGEDYVGFHSFMALAPAYQMSRELPDDRRALPVLKVLYRSSKQIQTKGGRNSEVLHDHPTPDSAPAGELFKAMRACETDRAEHIFAGIMEKGAKQGFNDLQPLIHDAPEVHRVVLLYRAWDILGLTGQQHAHSTLRQSLRYCLDSEKRMNASKYVSPVRAIMPKVIDQYDLENTSFGSRRAEDAWLDRTSKQLMTCNAQQAAELVAGAIKEGFSLESIGELLVMGANLQVLLDNGRTRAYPGKPVGSVHGDSIGVHASDSMNAWWNIARVSSQRNAVVGMVVGGFHLAQNVYGLRTDAYPLPEHLEAVKTVDRSKLLEETDAAIRTNNQARAAALASRYGDLHMPVRPMLDLLLKYAVSEDGSLHAEKYYRTVNEEFGRLRPAFRWREIVALARVTASEYGTRADGYEDACRLLGQAA
jgi:hypothetical protein